MSPDHGLWQYDGSGVNVAMGDDGAIGPHIDYTGRIDQTYASASWGNHGDHVAGIIMGAGNLNPYGRGNAPGAFLYVYDPFDNIDFSPSHYSLHDVRITSTSYSNGCNLGYSSFARFCDSTIRVHESLMHVASAGNNGNSTCTYATYPFGWGNVTGGFKVGKNVIAVANLDAYDNLAGSSSRGPARDGRIKPDVAAVGSLVNSTVSGNLYAVFSGTSMSCPGVSGILASLYQAYKEIGDGTDPNSALIKSILMNTAEDLGRPGPDFEFGYGRVNARRALEVLQDSSWFSGSASASSTDTILITIPAGTAKARFMLYWNDYEGIENAAIPLVNDLQLQVVDPSDNVYNPWILDHSPYVANLTANAVRGIDTINNVEQVTLIDPAPGTYMFIVHGVQVPQGPQLYFGNFYMDMDPIVLTYPIGGEGWAPGAQEAIRWDTQNDSTMVDLSYSVDGGSNWYSIAQSVNPVLGYYSWSVVDSISDQVKIRIEQGNFSFENNVNFTILGVPVDVIVSFVCSDTLGLNWTPVSGAQSYIVRRLGAEYMDSIAEVSTNFALITNHNNLQTNWYTVQAVFGNGRSGRAIATQVGPGDLNCNEDLAIEVSDPQGTISNCNGDGKLPIRVKISSLGPETFSHFNVTMEHNGMSFTDSISDTIGPGVSYIHEFADSLTFVTGLNSYHVWHDVTDDISTNDSSLAYLDYRDSVFVLPVSENFDLLSGCSTISDCELTSCSLGTDWFNHLNGQEDDIDWRVNFGSTPSTGTGPSYDHTTGTSLGNYIYLEASNGCTSHTALMSSPCIDLGTAQLPVLKFYYHMYGFSMGNLAVDVFSNGQWSQNVWNLNGDQGDQWHMAEVNLTAYAGQVIKLRFRGTTGPDYGSDLALDDIEILSLTSAPSVDFIASSYNDCVGSPIELIDQSGNLPSSWEWIIQPSTYQFINGTSALSQNPVVTFNDTGYYDVKLIVSNTIGEDSLLQTQLIYMTDGYGLPVTESFDQMSSCATTSNCDAEICPLDNGWVNLSNGQQDDVDWRVNSGSTPSTGTGPTDDFTGGGNYLYLEASNGCNFQEAVLLSPCIDLSVPSGYTPQLYFSYHMYGLDMGDLHVDIWSDGVWYDDVIPKISGDQGNLWHTDSVSLLSYVNTSIKIRFRGITGPSWESDIAIDNIGITSGEPLAVPDFTVSYNDPCVNQNFVFTDNSTGNVMTYLWEFGSGAFPSTASGQGPHTVQYITPGTKNVKLSLTNGGGTASQTQQISVNGGPNSAFTYSVPVVGTFDFSPVDVSNIDSVLWNFGDGNTSQLLNPSHTYTTNGTYLVGLQAWGPCGTTVDNQNILVSGIGVEEWLSENGFRMYPNPTQNLVYLEFDKCPGNELSIQLVDVRGRVVRQAQYPCSESAISVDLNGLSQGIYQVKISSGDRSASRRLVIH
jgi:PKD repeat protein